MAKRKAVPVETTTREVIKRAARRARKRSNPAVTSSLGHQVMDAVKPIGVGVAAYGGTRLVQRLAWTLTVKRKPRWAKHVHAAAGLLTFGALMFAGRRIQALEPHLEPVLIGSGVAAVQGVVTAYLPRFAWITGDPKPSDLDDGGAASRPQLEPGQQAQGDYLEEQLQAFEAGSARRLRPAEQTLQVVAAATGDNAIEAQLLEELGNGEALDDLYGGIFENPTLAP